jgi:cytochrome c
MSAGTLASTAVLGLALLGGLPAAMAEPSAAMRGRIAFLRCTACHALGVGEPHKTGPNLHGVIGGPAAQAAGYRLHAGACGGPGLRWDDATLRQWIRDPAALVPGTSMAYANALGDADVEALLVYLKAETRPR